MVSDIKAKTCTQWSQLMTVQSLVSHQVPLISAEIQTAMNRLAEMESLFQEVEVSLLALEESVEAREMQEKQLEERFQLAVYQEQKRAAFNQLSSTLESESKVPTPLCRGKTSQLICLKFEMGYKNSKIF